MPGSDHVSEVANVISDVVGMHFDIAPVLLKIRDNRRDFVWPRHIAMRLLYELQPVSFRQLGAIFRFSRRAAYHGVHKARVRCARNAESAKLYELLRSRVLQSINQ